MFNRTFHKQFILYIRRRPIYAVNIFWWVLFGKFGKISFFLADMAGLGKYNTGGMAGLGSIGLSVLSCSYTL